MSVSTVVTSIPELESIIFDNVHDDPRPVVIMTCGISGSGKSTFAHTLLKQHPALMRLSIDAYVYAHHGLCEIDFPAEELETYQLEAETSLRRQLKDTLRSSVRTDGGTIPNIILDFSFAFKETRDDWKHLIEENGGRWFLVYFDVEFEQVRRRVKERNLQRENGERRDADSAVNITEEVLEVYSQGFERPVGEGEIVLKL